MSTPSSSENATAVQLPALAKDLVKAFSYCLREEVVGADQGMELASLMLELASLHQFIALSGGRELGETAKLHMAECRSRVEQLSKALQLDAPATTAQIACRF